MKRWTVAAVVAVALVLVGVPAAALALSSHGSRAARPAATSSSHASPSASDGTKSPWKGWQHHRGKHPRLKGFARPPGAGPGMPFGQRKLTQAQRDQLADRFDAGAKRLQQAARCLRADTGSTALRTCLSKTFPRHPGLGHRWHGGPSGGPSGKASGGVSPQPRQG